jgi:hypothetical protein
MIQTQIYVEKSGFRRPSSCQAQVCATYCCTCEKTQYFEIIERHHQSVLLIQTQNQQENMEKQQEDMLPYSNSLLCIANVGFEDKCM